MFNLLQYKVEEKKNSVLVIKKFIMFIFVTLFSQELLDFLL